MKLEDRQKLGEDIAGLVLAAERKYPGEKQGRKRMSWCVREAKKRAQNDEENPSAEAAKWFGGMVLRLAVEVAVASINAYRKEHGL